MKRYDREDSGGYDKETVKHDEYSSKKSPDPDEVKYEKEKNRRFSFQEFIKKYKLNKDVGKD